MRSAFVLPRSEKIEVIYTLAGIRYKKILPNPKDNGLFAIALAKADRRIELNKVLDVRAFVPNVRIS